MTAATIQDHLQVAFRLAKRDQAALDDVANSEAAFWYSFLGMLLSLPFMLISITANSDVTLGPLGVLAETSVFIVGWLLFPVAMLEIVRVIDRSQHYFRYVAASNWCSVLEDGVLTLIVVLRFLEVLPELFGGLLFFGCIVWVLSFQFFVARNALQIDAGTAAVIIGVRLLLSLSLFAVAGIIGG